MKSSPWRQIPNMKGKKSYFFRCRCCDAFDFREKMIAKEHEREMRAARQDDNDCDLTN